MSKQPFDIKPGIYTVPNFGRIDCSKKVKQNDAVALYLNKAFAQFITLKEGGVNLLKKEKPTIKQLSQLVIKAKSAEEVDLLLKLTDSKTVLTIAETKKNSF